MKREVSKLVNVTAGIILFVLLSAIFVVSYVLLGLWFVVIPTIMGAFIGSKRYDAGNPGFVSEDIIKEFEEDMQSTRH